MDKTNAIEVAQPGENRLARPAQISRDQVELIKRTIAEDFTDDELTMFIHQSNKTGLDPLAKQIYAWKDKRGKVCIGASIDGFRLTAHRTGCYAPGRPTEYEMKDGKLISATVYVKVLAAGEWHEVSETAYHAEFVGPQPIWKQMPRVMTAKCAEARALRRAFPAELSGVYEGAEFDQVNAADPPAQRVTPRSTADLTTSFVDNKGADDLAHGKVKAVQEVTGTKNDTPWLRYDIDLDDGETYKTFDEDHGARAAVAKEHGRAVTIAFKVGKWGRDIIDFAIDPLDSKAKDSEPAAEKPTGHAARINAAQEEYDLSDTAVDGMITDLGLPPNPDDWPRQDVARMVARMKAAVQ